MADLVQIEIPKPKKGKKCIVKDCDNWTSETVFFGEICPECYAFITGRPGGEWSQAFRNAMGAAGALLMDHTTQLVAGRILQNYRDGVLEVWRRDAKG